MRATEPGMGCRFLTWSRKGTVNCRCGCFPKPSSSQVDFVKKKASAAVNPFAILSHPINKFAAGEVTRDRHGTGGSDRLILSSIQGPVPRGFAEGEEGLMTMRYEHDLNLHLHPPDQAKRGVRSTTRTG